MKKFGLLVVIFIFIFTSSAFALDLSGKVGLGIKVQSSGFIPLGTFQMFFSNKDSFEIEGGVGSLGWGIGGNYINHFTRIGLLYPYFSIGAGGAGPIGGAAFYIAAGIGVEGFVKDNLSLFAADKISIGIAPNIVAFTATIESGLRYYFQ